MRIIAGSAGGRRLKPPADDRVRPTSDRVKEAWFSSLAPRLRGARVLDLYSGSGALGLEAASRGAAAVVSVERDPGALAVLTHNVEACGLPVTVVATDVARAVGVGDGRAHPAVATLAPVDVVLADPPYALDHDELGAVLSALVPLLADDAQLWVEARRGRGVPWPDRLLAGRVRRYGDTELHTAAPASGGAT